MKIAVYLFSSMVILKSLFINHFANGLILNVYFITSFKNNIIYIQNIQAYNLSQRRNQNKKLILKIELIIILKLKILQFYSINSFLCLIFFPSFLDSWAFTWLHNSSLLSIELITFLSLSLFIYAN